MNEKIHPVLLCGGSGSGLWPLSRKSYPKQFNKLHGEESLFQAAASRLSGDAFAPPIAIAGSDFRFIVVEQLAAAEISAAAILIEPAPRNTAPAVLAAALFLETKNPGAIMVIAPTDHVIQDEEHLREAIETAVPAAKLGNIVALGVKPSSPETMYGWLKLNDELEADAPLTAHRIREFVEKPNLRQAEALCLDSTSLWNAGIYVASADKIIKEFQKFKPDLVRCIREAVASAQIDLGFTRLAPEPWTQAEDVSIDHAIMEKSDCLYAVPFNGAWSDLGEWGAVHNLGPADETGVVTSGPVVAIDCKNTLLRAEEQRQQLVGVGLENIVAIAMQDAVLVAHKDHAEQVKSIVPMLASSGITQAHTLPRDYRPWGWYESLVIGGRFQVKRIHVHPGASLSLQSHHHRSEHWIVVEGTAQVTVNDKVSLLTENESVYIPLGAIHRMENPGKVPMVVIEVQTGSYLKEDDIIRYEDVYARSQGAKG